MITKTGTLSEESKTSPRDGVGFFYALNFSVQDALMADLSDRLDRIDTKLDKLSEAVSQLARIEERISHQNENMGTIDARLNDMETRIRSLEQASSSRGVILAGMERFGWIIISALVGLVAYFFRK